RMKSSLSQEKIETFQSQYNKWIMVSITNSGTTIPENLQDKIFTPFFTTKPLGEGIGLGLYTCKKIVHEHNGALFFKSAEKTTEFNVILPVG
ncbi:MAG: sensor histidine kinase, partial [Spirochaetia bacterium]|nr:sensor histidine kinase [Spirochaetia bacterium]